MSCSKRLRFALLTLFLLSAARGAAQPFDATAFNLPEAARKIADCISRAEANQKTMFVASFRGFGVNDRGLAHAIASELQSSGYTIQPRAPIEIEGRLFRLPSDENLPLLGVKVNAQLVYATGESRKFSVRILDAKRAHAMVSPTGETLPPPTTSLTSNTLVSLPKPLIEPTIRVDRLAPSPASPYAISIVRITNGTQRVIPIAMKDGVPWIDLPLGSTYAIRLHNDSDFDAGVQVMIDGLSRFALSVDPQRHQMQDLVMAHKERLISGYYQDTQTVQAFQIGEAIAEEMSAAPDELQTITVSFAAAWKKGDRPPLGEPGRAKGIGTKPGPKQPDPVVKVARQIGATRAVLRVFYRVP